MAVGRASLTSHWGGGGIDDLLSFSLNNLFLSSPIFPDFGFFVLLSDFIYLPTRLFLLLPFHRWVGFSGAEIQALR